MKGKHEKKYHFLPQNLVKTGTRKTINKLCHKTGTKLGKTMPTIYLNSGLKAEHEKKYHILRQNLV
jgi:hypothetical protein